LPRPPTYGTAQRPSLNPVRRVGAPYRASGFVLRVAVEGDQKAIDRLLLRLESTPTPGRITSAKVGDVDKKNPSIPHNHNMWILRNGVTRSRRTKCWAPQRLIACDMPRTASCSTAKAIVSHARCPRATNQHLREEVKTRILDTRSSPESGACRWRHYAKNTGSFTAKGNRRIVITETASAISFEEAVSDLMRKTGGTPSSKTDRAKTPALQTIWSATA